MPRRAERKPDGSIAPKGPLPEMPVYTVTRGTRSVEAVGLSARRAVARAAGAIHHSGPPTYPYTLTVQAKDGGPIITVEISTEPREPVFRLRVV